MTRTELSDLIDRVRRSAPRSEDIATLCDESERMLKDLVNAAEAPVIPLPARQGRSARHT